MLIIVINAIIAGLISGAGVIIAQMANGGGTWPTDATWLVAGLTALVSAGKDWQSRVALPPVKVVTATLAALCLFLSGCFSPAMLREMAQDSATFCGRVTSVYGTVEYARTNIEAGDVECNGLKVRSLGNTVVPVQVKPVTP